MTKAILLAWLISSDAPPAKVDFDNVDACKMAAIEMQSSRIVARCVDLGKAS